ncbi:hypothetical protein GIB67_037909 [Kingdonia uniflora]|uniref:Glutathione S-transferase n=1 Tax=Kingdonia uniflora TaxID=39325 RepID=A0A7J7LGY6_9MAGN|nr:hypothetical protein GIB67_037909 [Kingdonia uniflora]
MAKQKEVKLLGVWLSPFVCRIKWVLKLKQVDYENIEEEDLFNNKSELLLSSNPIHKKIPVLLHNGKAIVESLNILEYIDETWPQSPLMPQDPYDRAMARFWAKFADEKFITATFEAFASEGEKQNKAIGLAVECLGFLEEQLQGKPFFGGETIGYLDIALGWAAYWLQVWEEVGSMEIMDPIKFPSINKWMNNFVESSVIKDNLPPRDKMVLVLTEYRKILAGFYKV